MDLFGARGVGAAAVARDLLVGRTRLIRRHHLVRTTL
jgi:hypothetical protein